MNVGWPNTMRWEASLRPITVTPPGMMMHNRKLFAARELKEERVEKFKELLSLIEEYKRKNQYQ